MKQRIALCPGSFDPITNGHLDIIRRASCLFDEVVVLVMINFSKTNTAFSVAERVDMARRATADFPNVRVDSYDGLLADYARHVGACSVVKLETLFLTTGLQYMYLSSSIVRQVAALGGDISEFVCPEIQQEILQRLYQPKP